MNNIRIVGIEYDGETAPADEWIKRIVEHLLLVELDLAPEDAGTFLISTGQQIGELHA